MKDTKFVCIQCGQLFFETKESTPFILGTGYICGNECLTNHFREHTARAEMSVIDEFIEEWGI